MARFLPLSVLVLTFLGLSLPVTAQGTRADYERAANHGRIFNDSKLKRHKLDIRWDNGERYLWYSVNADRDAREYFAVDLTSGQKREVDLGQLRKGLQRFAEEGFPRNLRISRLVFDDDYANFTFECRGKRYSCAYDSYTVSEFKEIAVEAVPAQRRPQERGSRRRGRTRRPQGRSPDGRLLGFVKDHNLWLRNLETKEENQLTKDGTASDGYGQILFSYDSKKLVCIRTRAVEKRKVHMVESSPNDRLQPKLHTHTYVKPGDKLEYSRPYLFHAETGQAIELDESLFENPWRNERWRWSKDSRSFTFLHNRRGHQALRLVSVDAETGECTAPINELSDTFIHYSEKTYLHQSDETNEIVWMSERSGWNHLYLFDREGKLKNQITAGDWVVKKVQRLDTENRQVWFTAMGVRPDQDPYHLHYCRVNFDGTGLTILTAGDGNHQIDYSPSGRYFTDKYQRVDLPPVVEVREPETGKLISLLEKADHSELVAAGWQQPKRFTAKGRDGKTDIWGIINLPTEFDESKKYPVIEQIYAGPHDSFVPKDFSASMPTMQLAELGFITVQIDGMGTSNRSKAFHDVCWQNLSDSGFPDRILWMKAAAEQVPQMDLTRVGIYGGSAGGQSALSAVLNFGDFYTAAAADCGCHDNGMDKIWWNEQWMGAMGKHYREQSNTTNAHKLKGKLLLTVGEMDRNVDPASTMQVVNALIKADKDFELIVFPGEGHGIGFGKYGVRRRNDFFVRSLYGIEPRRE